MIGKTSSSHPKLLLGIALLFLAAGCAKDDSSEPEPTPTVPHEERFGIYELDLSSQDVTMIATSAQKYSYLQLSRGGDRFVFSQKMDGSTDQHEEICVIRVDGSGFQRLTTNSIWDLYPVWGPGDSLIAFLSWRETGLDLYVMNSDGGNVRELYDSGSHDADPSWGSNRIAYTQNSQVWTIKDDGTDPVQLTDPPRAGEWGNANLPFGDYDPRWSPDASKVVFDRLEDDESPHGNYNFFVINADGSGETRLTNTGYSQGLASWSHSGDRIVFIVAAIGLEGKYDIYVMNADGTDNHNITPDYFPANFLCHAAMFSLDDSKVFFSGEWWE